MAKGVKRFFGDPTAIQKNYLISDFLRDVSGLPVVASVHVQVGVEETQSVQETAWLQSVAGSSDSKGMPNAIVAFCDLSADNAEEVLNQQKAYSNLRGIRQIVGRSPEEDKLTGTDGLLRNTEWKRNLSYLAEQNLSFDLQLIPSQMHEVAEVLQEIPNLKVALCHCGSPFDQSQDGLQKWRDGLSKLAGFPNVHCKISGFGMFDNHWTTNSIKPIVETVFDVFSPERCMFGSNFPVDRLYSDYARLYEAYFDISSVLSNTDRELVFFNNAQGFYSVEIS